MGYTTGPPVCVHPLRGRHTREWVRERVRAVFADLGGRLATMLEATAYGGEQVTGSGPEATVTPVARSVAVVVAGPMKKAQLKPPVLVNAPEASVSMPLTPPPDPCDRTKYSIGLFGVKPVPLTVTTVKSRLVGSGTLVNVTRVVRGSAKPALTKAAHWPWFLKPKAAYPPPLHRSFWSTGAAAAGEASNEMGTTPISNEKKNSLRLPRLMTVPFHGQRHRGAQHAPVSMGGRPQNEPLWP